MCTERCILKCLNLDQLEGEYVLYVATRTDASYLQHNLGAATASVEDPTVLVPVPYDHEQKIISKDRGTQSYGGERVG